MGTCWFLLCRVHQPASSLNALLLLKGTARLPPQVCRGPALPNLKGSSLTSRPAQAHDPRAQRGLPCHGCTGEPFPAHCLMLLLPCSTQAQTPRPGPALVRELVWGLKQKPPGNGSRSPAASAPSPSPQPDWPPPQEGPTATLSVPLLGALAANWLVSGGSWGGPEPCPGATAAGDRRSAHRGNSSCRHHPGTAWPPQTLTCFSWGPCPCCVLGLPGCQEPASILPPPTPTRMLLPWPPGQNPLCIDACPPGRATQPALLPCPKGQGARAAATSPRDGEH